MRSMAPMSRLFGSNSEISRDFSIDSIGKLHLHNSTVNGIYREELRNAPLTEHPPCQPCRGNHPTGPTLYSLFAHRRQLRGFGGNVRALGSWRRTFAGSGAQPQPLRGNNLRYSW